MSELETYYKCEVSGGTPLYKKNDVVVYLAKHLPKDCEWKIDCTTGFSTAACGHKTSASFWFQYKPKYCINCGGKIVEAPTE